ncbi:MAG: CAP domain-containing protein [Bacteroidales bacterium]|nr:CAP domain-containing protein [Bacteroidales bacterium]
MKTIFVLVLCTLWGVLSAQEILSDEIFQKWDKVTIEKANTGKDSSFLTDPEKEVILLCNLARMNGKLFTETFVKKYIGDEVHTNDNITSLISDLKNQTPMEPLYVSKVLYEAALEHAKESGENGTTGHDNFGGRYYNANKIFDMVGENCDYGNQYSLNIVMSLLIDEGVPSLGHRINILRDRYTHIGVSIQPHKTYRYNCVMGFGGE